MIKLTDEQLYKQYVGNVSPEYFVSLYRGSVSDAVSDTICELLAWDDPYPEDLEECLTRYIETVTNIVGD